MIFLMFANVDWELLYTFSTLAGATIAYPLSSQQQHIYPLLLLTVVYAPFHEIVMGWFHLPLEDMIDNQPSTKNVSATQVSFRSAFERALEERCCKREKIRDCTTDISESSDDKGDKVDNQSIA